MINTSGAEIEATVDRLIDEVGGWPGVTVAEHRFGGTEWRVGPREVGHVHAWGMLDVAYLRALRDALIDEGQTGVHHLLDRSGWTTFYVAHELDALAPSEPVRAAFERRRPGRAGAPDE